MGTLGTPVGDRDLTITPSPGSQPRTADVYQQSLSLMLGMAKGNRTPVRVCQTGMLMVNDAKMTDIVHYTATSDDFPVVGTVRQVSSVVVMGHPDNSGRVWVRPNGVASSLNGWPLDAGSAMNIAIDCFSQISALIATSGDTLIVAFLY